MPEAILGKGIAHSPPNSRWQYAWSSFTNGNSACQPIHDDGNTMHKTILWKGILHRSKYHDHRQCNVSGYCRSQKFVHVNQFYDVDKNVMSEEISERGIRNRKK